MKLPYPCPKCGAGIRTYSGLCMSCGDRPPAPPDPRDAIIARLRADLAQRDETVARLREALATLHDGARPLPMDRDDLGRRVREAWIAWAQVQPNPKPSWLVPYDDLGESDKEADRIIGERVARWTLVMDAARATLSPEDRGRG